MYMTVDGNYSRISVRGTKARWVQVLSQRVHVPNNWVLGFSVIVIIVQVLGKSMIIRYLDP